MTQKNLYSFFSLLLMFLLISSTACSNNPSESKNVRQQVKPVPVQKHSQQAKPAPILKTGDTAPDFKVTTSKGKKIKLSEITQSGKAALVLFYSAKCPHCKNEIQFLKNKIYPKYKDQGLEIIALSVYPLTGDMLKITEGFAMPWPVADDANRNIRNQYSNERAIPETFYVSKDGKIAYASLGFSAKRGAFYEAQVKKLLGM